MFEIHYTILVCFGIIGATMVLVSVSNIECSYQRHEY